MGSNGLWNNIDGPNIFNGEIMEIQYIITTALAISSGYFLYFGFSLMFDNLKLIESYKKLNVDIKKWPKRLAVVTRCGYRLDYDYPLKINDTSGIEGALAKEASDIDFYKEKINNKNNQYLYGDVLIGYEYDTSDGICITRSVGPFPGEKDISLLSKVKNGSKIKVYVNPDNEYESFIRAGTKIESDVYANKLIISDFKFFAYAFLLGLLSYLSTVMDSPF